MCCVVLLLSYTTVAALASIIANCGTREYCSYCIMILTGQYVSDGALLLRLLRDSDQAPSIHSHTIFPIWALLLMFCGARRHRPTGCMRDIRPRNLSGDSDSDSRRCVWFLFEFLVRVSLFHLTPPPCRDGRTM
jgi:hypothetical protein